jgi:cellulose biosynthesis protein BcsQ
MKIVGVYNIKGGVGKTAAAVNLAYMGAEQGQRTLVWDLDPQGAASFYFRIKPKVRGGGKALVKGRIGPDEVIKGTDFENLDLLPADFSYRHMDLELGGARKPSKQLLQLLRPLSEEYDLVFLDCPPSISLVSEAMFRAVDLLLVPVIPTPLSVRTLEQLRGFIDADKRLSELRLLPFFSMVDRRKRLHQELVDTLPERFPEILDGAIPYASEVERMGLHRAPLGDFAPGSRANQAYRELWREVWERL